MISRTLCTCEESVGRWRVEGLLLAEVGPLEAHVDHDEDAGQDGGHQGSNRDRPKVLKQRYIFLLYRTSLKGTISLFQ